MKPGNLYSKPQKMQIDPKAGQRVRIALTEKVPPVEDEPKVVDQVVEWDAANDEHAIVDNKRVKHTQSHSGEQLDTWQAVFSSVGDDGYP